MQLLNCKESRPASFEELLLVHSRDYLESIFANSPKHGFVHLDDDTAMNEFSLDAARYAAGSVLTAMDMVMAGEAPNAFCNIRPPGHHAMREHSGGFCIFNNIALGAAYALEHHGLKRVAIVDFDVHHGDGTEAIFHDDPRVLMCSTFRHPYYPFTGADSGNAHIINVPLAAGADGEQFRVAVLERWLPVLKAFEPEFIFISAGFDAHREDDTGGLALREADYAWVTELLMEVASHSAHRRIVSALEGGYALSALGRSVHAHIKMLGGF
jgi:acetoin utilization deacetylase AcuC-like enzyme